MLAVQSIGTPNTALNVAKVLELVLHDGINPATGILSGPLAAGQECKKLQDIRCYEELEELLKTYLTFFIEIAGGFEELVYDVDGKEAEFLQFSCLQDDCMTRGRGMLNGGYRYLGGTVETYGNITLSDSMEAIRKVVFEEKRCTLQELVEALDCDFQEKRYCSRRFLTHRNLETIRKRRMKLRFGCMSSSVRQSAARKIGHGWILSWRC